MSAILDIQKELETLKNEFNALKLAIEKEENEMKPKMDIIEISKFNPQIISVVVTNDHARFYSSNKEQSEWFVSLSNTGILYLSRDKGRTYYRLEPNGGKLPPVRFNDEILTLKINTTNKLVFFEKSDYDKTKKMFKIFYPDLK